MDSSITQLQRHLRQAKYSLTKPRATVFATLQGKEPQTISQLITACPGIDRASVYRTIELFEKLGVVQRLQIGWKYKLELSDTFSPHHHHMTCLRCNKVIAFDESLELKKQLHEVAAAHRFTVQAHQLEIQGLCEKCSALPAPTPGTQRLTRSKERR